MAFPPSPFHSLYGRLFGLSSGYLVAQDHNIQVATSATTGTNITAAGLTTISSAATTWKLAPPVPGLCKKIVTTSTSTLTRTVTLSTDGPTFQTTAGNSFITYTFFEGGQFLDLVGISTAIYSVLGVNSSAAPTT